MPGLTQDKNKSRQTRNRWPVDTQSHWKFQKSCGEHGPRTPGEIRMQVHFLQSLGGKVNSTDFRSHIARLILGRFSGWGSSSKETGQADISAPSTHWIFSSIEAIGGETPLTDVEVSVKLLWWSATHQVCKEIVSGRFSSIRLAMKSWWPFSKLVRRKHGLYLTHFS